MNTPWHGPFRLTFWPSKGSISNFGVSSPELLSLSLRPWVMIPLLAGAQGRFLLGTASPGRYTVNHTAPTQGSIPGRSAQERLGMHHSE